MNPAAALSLTADLHSRLRCHLFPGDGLEAAAILLCARTPGPRMRLLATDAIFVPHAACERREADRLTWPGIAIEEAIDKAEQHDLSLVLTHSHPGGLFHFSLADDQSDRFVIPSIFQALGPLHGTAIMVPNGAMRARFYGLDMVPQQAELVSVAGENIQLWWADRAFARRPLAFTSESREELERLCVAVIGVSGTGSIVAEQLARLGFGKVILIDFDKVLMRNLNRILYSTLEDAERERLKVDVLARAITLYRGKGVAHPLGQSISAREAVLLASQADVLCSCVDSLEGRHIADRMASAFLLPLLDVGVVIPTRRTAHGPAIADVCGRIDYVHPGGATLGDRGVYTPELLRAEYLRQVDPAAYRDEVIAGYLQGIVEEAPSVISLNMRGAADLVNEMIARLYPFRHDENGRYARSEFSLAAGDTDHYPECHFRKSVDAQIGRGAREPLLGLPSLAARRRT